MAVTELQTYYGNIVSPGYPAFRTVVKLGYSEKNDSGYHMVRKCYVEVTQSDGSTFTSNLTISWGTSRYALNAVGIYAESYWEDLGWYNYGANVSVSYNAYYQGGSGTIYRSTANASYDIPNVTFKVSYDANGGTGAPAAQTKTKGVTLKLSSTQPTRTGYTFLGWATSKTATAATYAAGANFTSDTNTTLYAVWKILTYTVAYDANGGSGAPSSQTKTYGVTLKLSTVVPTRDDSNFLGWATSKTATKADYASGANYTANAGVTLYAVWSAITYRVDYNANGGTGAPTAQTKVHGVTLKLSSTIPTRKGYKFLGWSTSPTQPLSLLQPGGSYILNFSATLYAIWELAYNCYVKVNGAYKQGNMYVKRNGVYVKASDVKVKVNGAYKGTFK